MNAGNEVMNLGLYQLFMCCILVVWSSEAVFEAIKNSLVNASFSQKDFKFQSVSIALKQIVSSSFVSITVWIVKDQVAAQVQLSTPVKLHEYFRYL